MKKEGFLLHKI